MITNQLGPPVTGDDFYDREKAIADVWDKLRTGNNLLLLAPRRVGKTSLMEYLQSTAFKHGFQAMFLSVGDVTTELGFVQRLYETVQEHGRSESLFDRIRGSTVGRYFRRLKKAGPVELTEDADPHWHELGTLLLKELATLDKPDRWLILVDELPLFILALLRQDPIATKARAVLQWFREIRSGPRAQKHVAWFIAGSIGLDTVARRAKLGDTINDLYPITEFGPFSEEVADQFLDELGKTYSMNLTSEVKSRLRERAGWLIPYHLQLVFAELRRYCHDQGVAPGLDAVEAAYEALFHVAKRNLFDWWEQRLARDLGPEEASQAFAVLAAAAKDPTGASKRVLQNSLSAQIADPERRMQQLNYLIDLLQTDGYLVEDASRYRFRSTLLREFWLRRVIGD